MSENIVEKVTTKSIDTESPIEELLLSTRAYNALMRWGIKTIEQLINYTDQDLLKIRNFGIKSLEEVSIKLQRYGLCLKEVELKSIDKEISISNLGLTFGLCEVLKERKIETVGQLIGYTEQELLKILNFRQVSKINMKLQEYGLGFKKSEAKTINKKSDIEELQLSTRSYYALTRLGIKTIEQLIGYTDQDLLKMWSFGTKSLEEVKSKLQKYGLRLKEVENKSMDNEGDINELQLSDRLYEILKKAGINTIEQLIEYTDLDLLKIQNLGMKYLEEIHIKIQQYRPQLKVLIVAPKKEIVVATMPIDKEKDMEVIINKLHKCGFKLKREYI